MKMPQAVFTKQLYFRHCSICIDGHPQRWVKPPDSREDEHSAILIFGETIRSA